MKTFLLLATLISSMNISACSDELGNKEPPVYKVTSDDAGSNQSDDAKLPIDPEEDRIPSTSSDTTIEADISGDDNPITDMPIEPEAESPKPETPLSGRALALPIGIENVNDSPMKAANSQTLLRFVPRTAMSIDRFYFGFKVQGADCDKQGTTAYGAGNGGIITGSLVTINAQSGLPEANIITESINACERFNDAYKELQNKSLPVLVWINAKVNLEANRMYGLIIRNTDPTPASNYFSFNMPIADTSLAGPHAKNNLDANAKGALLGLDPRELIAWTSDSGKNWKFGSENGQYLSYMNNGDKTYPATRMPQYGYRLSTGVNVPGQPYYAYNDDCTGCTTTYANAPAKQTFNQLSAYTSSGTNVGALTITNLKSSISASCTPSQGYGFRSCKLAANFVVEKGESYSIKASGSVEVLRMDNSQQLLFPEVGGSNGDFRMFQASPGAGTKAKDVPQIWAAFDGT